MLAPCCDNSGSALSVQVARARERQREQKTVGFKSQPCRCLSTEQCPVSAEGRRDKREEGMRESLGSRVFVETQQYLCQHDKSGR